MGRRLINYVRSITLYDIWRFLIYIKNKLINITRTTLTIDPREGLLFVSLCLVISVAYYYFCKKFFINANVSFYPWEVRPELNEKRSSDCYWFTLADILLVILGPFYYVYFYINKNKPDRMYLQIAMFLLLVYVGITIYGYPFIPDAEVYHPGPWQANSWRRLAFWEYAMPGRLIAGSLMWSILYVIFVATKEEGFKIVYTWRILVLYWAFSMGFMLEFVYKWYVIGHIFIFFLMFISAMRTLYSNHRKTKVISFTGFRWRHYVMYQFFWILDYVLQAYIRSFFWNWWW